MQALPSHHRHDPAHRDEAVDRVSRTTRWIIAGSLLGTGVLVGVAAHELPGKSASAPTTNPSGSSGTSGSSSSGATSSGGSSSSGSGNSSGVGSLGSGNGSSLGQPSVNPHFHASSGASS